MRNIKVLISTVETPEFRPNQHLSNKGIKQKINSRRIVLIGYWAYSTAYYDVASATEDCLYLRTKTSRLHSQTGVATSCFFSARKTLEAKPDSVAILCDSEFVNAILCASRSFKLRQFH